MLGPFATAAAAHRLFYIAIHQVSLLSHAATVARRVHVHNNIDDNDNNDNAWQRDRYGHMEWAQWLQSINDLEVYTPKVIAIAAFTLTVYHVLLVACCYSVSVAQFLRYYHF